MENKIQNILENQFKPANVFDSIKWEDEIEVHEENVIKTSDIKEEVNNENIEEYLETDHLLIENVNFNLIRDEVVEINKNVPFILNPKQKVVELSPDQFIKNIKQKIKSKITNKNICKDKFYLPKDGAIENNDCDTNLHEEIGINEGLMPPNIRRKFVTQNKIQNFTENQLKPANVCNSIKWEDEIKIHEENIIKPIDIKEELNNEDIEKYFETDPLLIENVDFNLIRDEIVEMNKKVPFISNPKQKVLELSPRMVLEGDQFVKNIKQKFQNNITQNGNICKEKLDYTQQTVKRKVIFADVIHLSKDGSAGKNNDYDINLNEEIRIEKESTKNVKKLVNTSKSKQKAGEKHERKITDRKVYTNNRLKEKQQNPETNHKEKMYDKENPETETTAAATCNGENTAKENNVEDAFSLPFAEDVVTDKYQIDPLHDSTYSYTEKMLNDIRCLPETEHKATSDPNILRKVINLGEKKYCVVMKQVPTQNKDIAWTGMRSCCGLKFSNEGDIEKHKRSFIHKKKYRRYVQKMDTPRVNVHRKKDKYLCLYCGQVFTTKDAVRYHEIAIHTKQFDTKCKQCDRGFVNRRALRQHVQREHSQRPFHQCNICDKKFLAVTSLQLHLKNHIIKDKPRFPCPICGRIFCKAVYLKKHMREFICGINGYPCKICHRVYRSWSGVVSHNLSIHNGEKPYNCGFCKKSFALSYLLKLHTVRVHTKEKTYVCLVCKEGFVDRQSFVRHYKVKHPKEKIPFKKHLLTDKNL